MAASFCSSRRIGLARLFGILATVGVVHAARAEERRACVDPRISVEGHLDARWEAPLARACERTRDAVDSDATARVRIVPAGADLIVEVQLEDGRSTLRRVRVVENLAPTLEALLVLPPASKVPQTDVPPPAPVQAVAPPIVDARTVAAPAPVAPPAPVTPVALGVEIGGGMGVRIAGREAYLSLAPSLFANLRVGSWLFGVGARWEVFQSEVSLPASGFEMETLGTGLSVARRFRPSFGTVDVGVAPRLLAETQSFLVKGNEIADTQTDVRIATFARLAMGDAALRFFVDLDFELSPGRLRRDIRIDPALPPLPSWSSGLTAGVAWGDP